MGLAWLGRERVPLPKFSPRAPGRAGETEQTPSLRPNMDLGRNHLAGDDRAAGFAHPLLEGLVLVGDQVVLDNHPFEIRERVHLQGPQIHHRALPKGPP